MEMNTDNFDWKRDAFTDEQHQSLNKRIMSLIESYADLSMPSRPLHLSTILSETYHHAQEFNSSLVAPDLASVKSALENPSSGLRKLLEQDIE